MSDTSEAEVGTIAGPGRRLAGERKAQGLALEQVSGQLRLSLQTLQALENDDYAHLPPAAFVTGYLRSYARLLGLPEQEIIDHFTNAGKTPQVVARSQRRQVRASDPPVRALTYLIFGGLLVMSGLWWVSQRETPETAPAMPQVAANTQETAGEATALQPQPELAGSAEALSGEPGEIASLPAEAAGDTRAVPAGTANPEPANLSAAPAAAVEQPALTQAAASPTPTPAAPAPAPAAPEETAPPKPAAPPPPPLTAEMPQSKLVLELTGESWAEITDASGRKLANGMLKSGTVTLRGEAPFKMFFGYAPGVQVNLNGEAFDHRPYQRRNDTARFRLGNADDNTLRTD